MTIRPGLGGSVEGVAGELERIARRYRRFATDETEGISPLYTALAYAVADDRPTLEFLSALPRVKQQPNLLFAAVRQLTGTLEGAEDFLTRLHDQADDVRQIMLSRSNQMNEPARCGVLLPLLAQIDGPLSLVEVGASAGLCLLPDRYRYRWTRPDGTEHELGNGEPQISLPVTGPVPIPERLPEIVWRAGLDLHPVDLTDPDQREWLLALIWPEHTHRAERLQAAMEVALADRPPVSTGDLRDGLPALVAEAPADSTVVVIHSAVLAYLPSQEEIDAFAATVQGLDVRWVSNEPHQVFPDHNTSRIEALGRDFSLMLDGVPVAAAGPHGQSLRWF